MFRRGRVTWVSSIRPSVRPSMYPFTSPDSRKQTGSSRTVSDHPGETDLASREGGPVCACVHRKVNPFRSYIRVWTCVLCVCISVGLLVAPYVDCTCVCAV